MKYQGQTEYDHKGPSPKRGVLLCNLGTPDAPKTPELRRYLKEFLSDPRVVEVPRLLWWMILNLIILRIRPRRSAKLYQTVWSEGGSPLLVHSKAQVAGVKKILDEKFNDGCAGGTGYALWQSLYGIGDCRADCAECSRYYCAASLPPVLWCNHWLNL